MRLPPHIWPLPALLTWAVAWSTCLSMRSVGERWLTQGSSLLVGFVAGCAIGAAAALLVTGRWRRAITAFGFPASFMLAPSAVGSTALPIWAWLLAAGAVLWLYPPRAWSDAPVFPTPHAALDGLAGAAPLPPGARVLDAGCGLGDGLVALRRAYPGAGLDGLEWSWPLVFLGALRCRIARTGARVRRGDIWRAPWAGYALVYLFQRPESMARAMAKADAEMAPGSWLASLEFPVPGRPATVRLQSPDGRPVWLYRLA